MGRPSRGMVLAAGFGTRLLPVTRTVPKAWLPVAGEPLLLRILRWLSRQGVRSVAVNAHHRADELERGLAEAAPRDPGLPEIRLFREAEILGTAGGIANAAAYLQGDPVVVANSDQLFEVDLDAPARLHASEQHLATLLLARDPRRAQVRLDGTRVAGIAPRPVYGEPDLWAFTGVYLLAAEAVDRLRRGATREGSVGFLDLVPLLRDWMREGRVGGYAFADEPFREIGTPEAWLELLRETTAAGASWIDPSVSVPPDAAVEESIVLSGASIAPGARVRRSILGPGASARGLVDRVITAGGETRALALLERTEEAELAGFLESGWPRGSGDSDRPRPAPARFTPRLLRGGGSARRILRVGQGDETRILVLPPPPGAVARSVYPERPGAPSEAESFRYVTGYLTRLGVRVPRLDAFDPLTGRALLEDLGDRHLADLRRESSGAGDADGLARVRAAYEEAVDLLVRMQAPASPVFDPARTHNPEYDEAFILQYEAGYFLREMARTFCGLAPAPGEEAAVREECRAWAQRALEAAPRCFLHRDYQSRNLMVTPRGLAVIDVQGARLGPPEYDLASLVEDPYADLPAEWRDSLIERYHDHTADRTGGHDRALSRRRYEACLVNRLLQALGAFAYLGGTLGKPGFLEHAPAALRTLRTRAPLAGSRLQALLDAVEETLRHRGR